MGLRVRRFPQVDEVGHVALWSKPQGIRASLVNCDGSDFDTVLRYPSELEALQALRSELVEAHDRRIALIDAAIAEVTK